ncbi:MAG: HAMP domain-containing histidine kinase, partial [bacterium]|nr:HAMP domain-containing histidine kinase [bacterium]
SAMIVHDLKNHVNAIIYFSQESFGDSREVINQSARQVLTTLSNILDVQKFEDAKMQLDMNLHPLAPVAENALGKVGFLASQKNIRVENNIAPDVSAVMDVEIVGRVFINLFTNALKHTPKEGKITVDAAEKPGAGDFLQVSVTDTGDGIPEEMLHLVFDKFRQVEIRRSGLVRSTGLGLTFCKLAVESHGGTIGVQSEVGKGSDFHFTLSTKRTPY